MRPAAALALGLFAALAGCEATGEADYVDPRLVQFCRQQGYGPEAGERHQWCLERHSMAGRGRELDPREAGLDVDPP